MTIPKYVWGDLETTGLEPGTNLILEVAMIVTDKDLNQIGEPFQSLVWNGKGGWGSEEAKHEIIFQANDRNDPEKKPGSFVRAMHTKNGLLAELDAWQGRLQGRPEDVEKRMIEWLTPFMPVPVEGQKVEPLILAGATIGAFDRQFLIAHMPKFISLLSHRNRDVSSDKMVFIDALGMEFPKAEAHRAMDDVKESLGQAREIYAKLKQLQQFAAAASFDHLAADAAIDEVLNEDAAWGSSS